jgi:hypothetical protein
MGRFVKFALISTETPITAGRRSIAAIHPPVGPSVAQGGRKQPEKLILINSQPRQVPRLALCPCDPDASCDCQQSGVTHLPIPDPSLHHRRMDCE